MKILELTTFSAGICGVGARVKQEAEMLAKNGHEVLVCSSNRVKGQNGHAKENDEINGFKIKRFGAIKLGGESFMRWNPTKEGIAFKPDVIFAHAYRHWHTKFALKIAESTGAKVYLVTHAPFEREETRSVISKLAVNLYDIFVGPKMLLKFNKVIAITKWEYPYLHSLGLRDGTIEYIPNGIGEEFFDKKKHAKEENKILFLGRIAPIKQIETVIRALDLLDDKKITLELVGPEEKEYGNKLRKLVNELSISDRVTFSGPVYETEGKIRKLDSAKIFVLPSKSEGMPQSLIEALSRGKIAIASDNSGVRDLVNNGKNGILFGVGDVWACKQAIDNALKMKIKEREKMQKNAIRSVEKFRWDKIINQVEKLIKQ